MTYSMHQTSFRDPLQICWERCRNCRVLLWLQSGKDNFPISEHVIFYWLIWIQPVTMCFFHYWMFTYVEDSIYCHLCLGTTLPLERTHLRVITFTSCLRTLDVENIQYQNRVDLFWRIFSKVGTRWMFIMNDARSSSNALEPYTCLSCILVTLWWWDEERWWNLSFEM